jgi:hypothetical protein
MEQNKRVVIGALYIDGSFSMLRCIALIAGRLVPRRVPLLGGVGHRVAITARRVNGSSKGSESFAHHERGTCGVMVSMRTMGYLLINP